MWIITLILAALFLFLTILSVYYEEFLPFAFCGIVSSVLFLATYHIITEDGYKQGQIDALTGKVQYKLYKNADSTVEWVEIKTTKP